jgi:hypothetical protein
MLKLWDRKVEALPSYCLTIGKNRVLSKNAKAFLLEGAESCGWFQTTVDI